MYRARGRLE